MAGSPRIIARPTTDRRQPAAVLASGSAEEAPSLTAAARDGDGKKNARGEGRTKKWNDKGRQK